MTDWHMLTLVGADRPGIVAAVTERLYRQGWSLGEASALRLGGNFPIMMMVAANGDGEQALEAVLRPLADAMDLRAFGARRRTWCGPRRWGAPEWGTVGAGVLLVLMALLG